MDLGGSGEGVWVFMMVGSVVCRVGGWWQTDGGGGWGFGDGVMVARVGV